MGCNESKHDVITGTTITKKQAPLHKDSNITNSMAQKVSELEYKNSIKDGNDHDELVGMTDVKVVDMNTDIKGKGFGELVKESDDEKGRLISSSPDHFVSSRKLEDAVSAIIAEGEEGGSEVEYHSPVHELARESEERSGDEKEREISMEKLG